MKLVKQRISIIVLAGMLLTGIFSSLCLAQIPGVPRGVPRSDVLVVVHPHGRVGMPDNFNLWAGWRWQGRGLHQFALSPLWTVDFTRGEILCQLARELPSYNKDFTEMTIKLRKGVYWNDGVPFTADDVVFTIELVKQIPELEYHGPIADFVKKVYKLDDYTVRVELKKPNSRFHYNFLERWSALRPMPKHIFEKVEDVATFKFNPPVGTGPYKLYDYDPAGFWTSWIRREDWDRSPTGILYGKPQPKYIVVRTYESKEMEVLAFLRNEVDLTSYLTPPAFKTIIEKSKTALTWRKEWPWIDIEHPCITGLTFNTAVYPYNIKDVRWALTLAIDIVDYNIIAAGLIAKVSPIHLTDSPAHRKAYYEPIEEWLKKFELDVSNGRKFKPYDPEVPFKLAKAAKERGYPVPEEPEAIRKLFGIGWWKYAPEIATKLLEKHGFYKDKKGKWHLPDGSPWKIQILTITAPGQASYLNGQAAAELWRRFGIDATLMPSEASSTLTDRGEFKVCTSWPATESWGAGIDLYKVFQPWHSRNIRPLGEVTMGHASRWSNPQLDKIIERMEKIDPLKEIELTRFLGIEGLKIAVEEMPGIPTYAYPTFTVNNTYHWTNWPSVENPYGIPLPCWPNLKYVLPFLQSTGR